ncbi:phosphate transport system permease protein [Fontimonas thermophila]|uniref:Phosphate transport system permease protein PstA n=1 Tax=Fontimonas thermophila TaxID=1076937 RepID=A0A1I2HYN0_9GAMM|nr:phosphate ABC transporter permease PstA [Fontimonas thermophila]SFF34548.1 phosphate transport system permease protein [Fontimonas thermophila]
MSITNPDARSLVADTRASVASYIKSGQPYIWLTAAAITVAFIITCALLVLTAARGLPHFWPAGLVQARYLQPGAPAVDVLAEIRSREEVTAARLKNAGLPVSEDQPLYERLLIKVGNRDLLGSDFRFVLSDWLVERSYPRDAVVLERMEWGNFHGFLESVRIDGKVVEGEAAWTAYRAAQGRVNELRERIRDIEKVQIGSVNYELERLRLAERRLQIEGKTPQSHPDAYAELAARRKEQDARYQQLREQLVDLNREANRDTVTMRTVDGQLIEMPIFKLVDGYRPNAMGTFEKLGHFFAKVWSFVSDEPREANTEGGIFPAIFGTVLMVLIMSVIVTPFGILAALYLREYARQGPLTQAIRIAVNNLAGVPSIVFGMFGLGFFVYFIGAGIDRAFYPEASPAPVFGTPGLLWSSLTLALLTLPVVIVATEEGLARIPRSIREASLALGATKAETLWRVVLPMASPAMMTGLILAIARAAGEVAPLMLVGVVKLAPSLPLDGNFPFIHLERKFMHLGFHIYDVGFQSPNVEAARPLVYATSFLLVLVVISLNVTAITIRNRLRERYKALDH